MDAAILDLLTGAPSGVITDVGVGTRIAVVAAVARLRSVRTAVCRVAKLIFRASVAIVAIDRRAFAWRKTPVFFAVALMVNGAYVVVTTEPVADRIARPRHVAMREMRRQGLLADGDRVKVRRVSRRDMADLHLRGGSRLRWRNQHRVRNKKRPCCKHPEQKFPRPTGHKRIVILPHGSSYIPGQLLKSISSSLFFTTVGSAEPTRDT